MSTSRAITLGGPGILIMHEDVVNHEYPFSLIRTIGAASTVLLKNERNVLPLKAPKSIAVIGQLNIFNARVIIDNSLR